MFIYLKDKVECPISWLLARSVNKFTLALTTVSKFAQPILQYSRFGNARRALHIQSPCVYTSSDNNVQIPPSGQGLRFRFRKKFRWPPEMVYRPKFRGFPVISTGKRFQIQNSEISVSGRNFVAFRRNSVAFHRKMMVMVGKWWKIMYLWKNWKFWRSLP